MNQNSDQVQSWALDSWLKAQCDSSTLSYYMILYVYIFSFETESQSDGVCLTELHSQ